MSTLHSHSSLVICNRIIYDSFNYIYCLGKIRPKPNFKDAHWTCLNASTGFMASPVDFNWCQKVRDKYHNYICKLTKDTSITVPIWV